MAAKTTIHSPPDHRTRVGHERRARTRQRIIESALGVIAAMGPDVPVIDDFIQAAAVARGTFYNHFTTSEELLTATSGWLEDALVERIESVIGDLRDPDQRLATGVRLWLQLARRDPVFCAFVVRSRFRGPAVERQLQLDLGAGLRSGQLVAPSIQLARDLVVGTIREAQARMMDGRVPATYPDEVARLILRALRVDERRIKALLSAPLPPVAHGSRRGGGPLTGPWSPR